MAPRDAPPFRADHVGSLLRPPALLRAREGTPAGAIDDGRAARGIEDEAIRDVVRLQEEVGLRTVTDGEFRRASWHMDFIYQLDGISKVDGRDAARAVPQRAGDDRVRAALGARRRAHRAVGDDLRGRVRVPAAEASDRQMPKLTIPSPSMVHYRGGRAAIDEAVYPDLDASGRT